MLINQTRDFTGYKKDPAKTEPSESPVSVTHTDKPTAEPVTNSADMKFVCIKPGTFTMGSPMKGRAWGLYGNVWEWCQNCYTNLGNGTGSYRIPESLRSAHASFTSPGWVKQHDTCILMTHHPPAWLNPESPEHLNT